MQVTKDAGHLEKIRPRVTFVQTAQHLVIHRFDGTGHEEAPRVAQGREVPLVFQQVLDLDGYVVGEPGKFLVQGFDNGHGMPAAIEEIRIAEGNMLRSGRHLLANVREHNFTIHYPEHALVNRHDRAMAAQMLASAARFGITGKAMLAGRKDEVRVARKRRESLPVGRKEFLPGQRNQRLELRNACSAAAISGSIPPQTICQMR
jgi:hypothetical protein